MMQVVPIAPLPPDRFHTVLSKSPADAFDEVIARGREALSGRVIWNVNSTATGGGVAEMLRSLIAYARGAGVDARWVVMEAPAPFFAITKRLHNRLHGAPGDGGRLGPHERRIYEKVTAENATALAALVAPGDIVLLHDPQTAGMTNCLLEAGAHVIWRCHIGLDRPNRVARSAWDFLLRYVEPAEAYVFSRETFPWTDLDRSKLAIIAPSIDAFAPKNQPMTTGDARAILAAAGLVDDGGDGLARFTRNDGTPGRIDRRAKVWEDAPPARGTETVVHVSRWDRLKDPVGTMAGFADYVAPHSAAHLYLVGPDVDSVADDPEGMQILQDCVRAWESLAPEVRSRVHLVALPMEDAEENAAIVNAIQRSATVVVQKSRAEGFGLTVAEAMWKRKPVVASRIGGIQDQIVDGESGVLISPDDLEAFGKAIVQLLADPQAAALMGAAAQARVRDSFLGPRHFAQYLSLFSAIIASRKPAPLAIASA
ncbi:MAG: trehalose synthase [Thermoleophilaceae bacterium]|jgi:trehalose synthase|nr:trehalose synthase [Thermoleophilaceae bacterium]